MQPQAQHAMRWMPLLALAVAGLIVGVGVGFLMWSSGAANYAVVSTAKDATRTVRVHTLSVTFPSVAIVKVGSDTSIAIELTNGLRDPVYATLSLALVRNNGIDTTTTSSLTSQSHTVTLASYATANQAFSLKPTSTGYAFFDLLVNDEIAGTIALYVVPS